MKRSLVFKALFGLLALVFAALTVACYFNTGIVDPSGVSMAALNMGAITLDANFGAQDGDENMGGLGVICYFGAYSHIATWPTFTENPSTKDTAIQSIGNFGMVSQKYFIKLYCNRYPELSPESQGEHIGGKSFKLTGKVTVMGFKKDERFLARVLNNSQGVFIFMNDDGDRIAMGTQYRPAQFKLIGKTGAAAADMVGFEIEISADSHIPGYEYNGSIPLSGSTIDPIS